MSNVFTLLLVRETRLMFRRPAELVNPLVFFFHRDCLVSIGSWPRIAIVTNHLPRFALGGSLARGLVIIGRIISQ